MAAQAGSPVTRAILLDIEGTTTPIDFVFRTLFPYARAHVEPFLNQYAAQRPSDRETGDEARQQLRRELWENLRALGAQHDADSNANLNPPGWPHDSPQQELASAAAYVRWLIDRDSKCSALKSLQGKIWQEGYRQGELHGEVYPDVPKALDRWTRASKTVCIFSSGSVLAQKLLFGSTSDGNLTRFLTAYFDTATGPKNEPQSYARIATTIGVEPSRVLFVSDVVRELDAARQSGMQTALCVRGEAPASDLNGHPIIHSFDELSTAG